MYSFSCHYILLRGLRAPGIAPTPHRALHARVASACVHYLLGVTGPAVRGGKERVTRTGASPSTPWPARGAGLNAKRRWVAPLACTMSLKTALWINTTFFSLSQSGLPRHGHHVATQDFWDFLATRGWCPAERNTQTGRIGGLTTPCPGLNEAYYAG